MDSKTEKKYKTFKEYYSDPEFKKKHLEYINTRVKCECGITVVRCGLSRHKRTVGHKRTMDMLNSMEITEEQEKRILEKLLNKYNVEKSTT